MSDAWTVPDGDDRTALVRYWANGVGWLLLSGDRGTIAAVFAGLFAAGIGLLGLLGAFPLSNSQALYYAYGGLISGNLTLVTVVVSINQLLLSRELQTPDELRTQMDSVIEYRKDVEEAADRIAPVKPLGFLRVLVESTREESQRLGGIVRYGDDGPRSDEIEDVVTRLTAQMDRIDELLVESNPDTFSVVSMMLETNYAEQINRLRAIRATHEATLSDAASESIDDLIERLQEVDIARQYFKSIYLQQELSVLSPLLLYVGLPALAVAIASLLFLTVLASEPAGPIDLHLFLPVTLTIGVLPLSVLGSFFLRMATVTRLTAATLPFTPPEQESSRAITSETGSESEETGEGAGGRQTSSE